MSAFAFTSLTGLCRRVMIASVLLVNTSLCLAQVPIYNSYPAARATVYLDFDGQVVKGTSWNWDGTITARPSGLTSAKISEIYKRVAEDFRIFNLNITTDQAVYLRAPITKRLRLILTPTYQWYGNAGGVAFVNSFTWGDDTPAWVFTPLLDNNAKYIAEAASHEIGHTLGLQHQSTYSKTCALVTEYAEGRGTGEIGWAPIMGVSYYRNYTTWTFGPSIEGCKVMQNDISIISKGLNQIGLRNDDFGNTRTTATPLTITNNKFSAAGLINHATDKDFFRIQLLRKSRLQLSAAPASVGTYNSGANADLFLSLMKSTGDTIKRANPLVLLSASIDTFLLAGTYYIGVDGVKNVNVSDYASAGWYTLSGVITPTATSTTVVMKGTVNNTAHILTWDIDDQTSVIQSFLEKSLDGVSYLPLSAAPLTANYFSHEPHVSCNVYYRLRMVLPDSTWYYSNEVILSDGGVSVVSTLVRDRVQVNVPREYQYQIFDELGRLHARGRAVQGMNTIELQNIKRGILVLKLQNAFEQHTFKLIKQ